MNSIESTKTTIKLHKYRKSGETLAKIISRRCKIDENVRDRIVDFVVDLARADELVERIVDERDLNRRRDLYRDTLPYIRKYTGMSYSGVLRLFQADLRWNRNRDVRSSVELSREIYRFIYNNITHFYDRDVENLIILSNLLDDLFDIWKDRRFSMIHMLDLVYNITVYSLYSIGIILRNIDLLGELVLNVKYIFRGGFESEKLKNTEIDIRELRY
ncbi:MAG: hypothetical protein NZ908_00150 [Candidatus Micrarchaeota archaeon]|nr:hypothetical protein [Candidatus Micrarchaeota archaeon]MCX8154220.1 hypothetical protein [Candidatus Micrarchaeota archaeon]